MRAVAHKVQTAVNHEVAMRIKIHYPNGNKLQYQSPNEWIPNAAFVNCYKGGAESVGYHSDQLTYLGPRAVIGSLSLGVAREFRVRKIVARDREEVEIGKPPRSENTRADVEGQMAIHLPHNSLLVMHAEMQEEWKHSIHPAQVIDPHPIAGNKRINITYRYYRESFHPRFGYAHIPPTHARLFTNSGEVLGTLPAVSVTLRPCCAACKGRRKAEADICGCATPAMPRVNKGAFEASPA